MQYHVVRIFLLGTLMLQFASTALAQAALDTLVAQPPAELDLAEAALRVDQLVNPQLDLAPYLSALERMTEELRVRLADDVEPRAQLEQMAHTIYGEWDYANVEDLPADVFVGFHKVLDKQQWNCFGMSVLYLVLGERLGVPLRMVSGRGHVFVEYRGDRTLYVETTQQGAVHDSKQYLKEYLPFPCLRPEEYVPLDEKETISVLLSQTALALQHAGQTARAVELFKRALQFDATHAEACAGLGFISAAQGQAQQAIAYFRDAIEADPNLREAIGGMGSVLYQSGELGAALKAFERAVELCPDEPPAVFNYGQVLQHVGQDLQAVQQFRHYVTLRPREAEGYMALALALEDAGDLDAAREAYRKVLELQPNSADARVNLGYVLERQQLVEEAERSYRAALEESPEHPMAWAGLGRIESLRKAYDEAGQSFDRALAADPGNATLWIDLGNLHRAQGDNDAAIAAYEKAVSLEAENEEARKLLQELRPEEQ